MTPSLCLIKLWSIPGISLRVQANTSTFFFKNWMSSVLSCSFKLEPTRKNQFEIGSSRSCRIKSFTTFASGTLLTSLSTSLSSCHQMNKLQHCLSLHYSQITLLGRTLISLPHFLTTWYLCHFTKVMLITWCKMEATTFILWIQSRPTITDENIKTHGPIQVPIGPVTRARAKRFKEELNNLVRRVLQQEESMFTTKGEQRLVVLLKFDPGENQSAIHAHGRLQSDVSVF